MLRLDVYPWLLDVDISSTKEHYTQYDHAVDRTVNQKFIQKLSPNQMDFFIDLGVDLLRVKAEEKIYDIPDEKEFPGVNLYRLFVDFVLCGNFLALPDFQWEIYRDAEVLGNDVPEDLEVRRLAEEGQVFYQLGNLNMTFKHPVFRMKEGSTRRKWDCGYIIGSILIWEDLS